MFCNLGITFSNSILFYEDLKDNVVTVISHRRLRSIYPIDVLETEILARKKRINPNICSAHHF